MVKLNKIYTRTGDAGTTGLVDGSRLPKHAPRMQAVGDVDEANSAIGLAVLAIGLAIGDAQEARWLTVIQNDLFDLGADLATPVPEGADEPWALRIVESQVKRLEAEIDLMNAELKPLDSFILPGGSPAAAAVHLARAVTRRAERSATAAAAEVAINPQALAYLNRLSDLLFVMARRLNGNGASDIKWVPGASR
ncbi:MULTISPECIES: cob(I)yrinic acid a,c-diamide adenosyltransferase [Sphingobium]|jgi:cob(I)alamin adenosyltransferase|uniref:Corrinoid adenosyltransferase n=1 Tax=Sphingobium baderi TaxID=1332080 RepID=A0A0S3EU56_9SPHN|nr:MULTISPECIES: cob(I)yrinic acid a,c-diamide adenosyltransferase [Sphingobium]ALR18968.1 cob(I)yrinic acid a c-diamide adenosyltransferase [Sphingobium baderi]